MTLFKFLLLFSLVGGASTAVGFKHFNSTTEVKNSFAPESSISSINLIIDDTKKNLKKTLSEKLDALKATIKKNNQLKISKSSEKKSTNTKFETAKTDLEKKKTTLINGQKELENRISILNKKQQDYLEATKKHFEQELKTKENTLYKTFYENQKKSLEAQKKLLFDTIPSGCTPTTPTASSIPPDNLDSYSCTQTADTKILTEIKQKYQEITTKIKESDKNISTYLSTFAKLNPSQEDAKLALDTAFTNLKTKNSKIDKTIDEINQKEQEIQDFLTNLRDLEKQINDLTKKISELTSESQLLQKNIDSIK